jgi:hypothetical protein
LTIAKVGVFRFLMNCRQSLLSLRTPGKLKPRKGGTARSRTLPQPSLTLINLHSFSSTLIHSHQPSFTLINLHSLSSILIHSHQPSFTLINPHSLSSTPIHSHQPSFTLINFELVHIFMSVDESFCSLGP